MQDLLIRGAVVDGVRSDIDIRKGVISAIAPEGTLPVREGVASLDAAGLTALPGFVNMHTHAAMSLMRGIAEDVSGLDEWLSDIWKIESKVDEEFIYWGTKVACLEMIKTGTTTFNDQYWFVPMAYKAATEMGIRPVLSYVLLDHGDPAKARRQREECEQLYEETLSWGPEAIFAVAPHAIYTVSEENLLWGAAFARERGLKIHIHVSETEKEVADCRKAHGGLSPVEYLDRLGILSKDVIAAHALWLSDEDIEILSRRGVNCVHNINSNTKLASGWRFRYKELHRAGVNVCIGTDGCASSNNLDMLEAMKTSALVQKAWRGDPTAMPMGELLDMATAAGGRALDLPVGKIAEGYLADLMLVDTSGSFFLSPAPFLANFIYSAHSDCIRTLICGGRIVMKDRSVPGEEEVLSGARAILEKITR